LEDLQHLFDAAHPRAVGHLPSLAQGADRNVLRVNIETDVKHKAPLNSTTSEQLPLVPRYPTDRGFLHSFTPRPIKASLQLQSKGVARSGRTPCHRRGNPSHSFCETSSWNRTGPG